MNRARSDSLGQHHRHVHDVSTPCYRSNVTVHKLSVTREERIVCRHSTVCFRSRLTLIPCSHAKQPCTFGFCVFHLFESVLKFMIICITATFGTVFPRIVVPHTSVDVCIFDTKPGADCLVTSVRSKELSLLSYEFLLQAIVSSVSQFFMRCSGSLFAAHNAAVVNMFRS